MTAAEKTLMLVLLLAGAGLLYLLAPVLTPFLIAALLAYLGDPLADFLERHKCSRTVAVVIVFGFFVALFLFALLVLVPLLQQQFVSLIAKLPLYLDTLQQRLLPWVSAQTGLQLEQFDVTRLRALLEAHWKEAGGIAAQLLGTVLQSGMTILAWLMNLLLVPVVTFYLLRDWDVLLQRVHELVPRRWESAAVQLARNTDEVLGAFLRGQLMVMLALGMLYALGLWWVGLEFAFLIGLVAGLLSFVPYLGFIVGFASAIATAYVQFHDVQHLLLVGAVFGFGQLLEGMVLTPKLVGERIGLHPVAVIFAVLAGGQLFGFFGILLALPAAAVIMVLLRYTRGHYLRSRLYAP